MAIDCKIKITMKFVKKSYYIGFSYNLNCQTVFQQSIIREH